MIESQDGISYLVDELSSFLNYLVWSMFSNQFGCGSIRPEIFDAFTEMCADFGVPLETVSSKAALGKACHIDVDASVVVVRKQK